MANRIQITQLTYMMVQGQPCLVDKGTVLDVPDASKFSSSSATILAEAPGTLLNNRHAQVVRNKRFR